MITKTEKTVKQAELIIKNSQQIFDQLRDGNGIFPTVTLWMDLLAFNEHLNKVNWDIHKEETLLGMRRINVLHEVALLSMNARYEVVQLNDAVVISQDIPSEDAAKSVTDFLALADYNFEVAVLADLGVGGKGVRGVIATGYRYNLRGNIGWMGKKTNPALSDFKFSCPRPIMMNTAFGRAYGVESAPELHSLREKVSCLYVEQSLIINYGASIMETWDVKNVINMGNFGSFMLVRK
jgi:hypothetical protein